MKVDYIERGDCLELLKTLPSSSIDLTITSPPYDNLRKYNGFTWCFSKIAKELFRVTKDGGVIVWIVSDATINGSETGTSFKQALEFKEIGFNLHDTMIWEKPTFTATGSLAVRYAPVFEYMFILSKGKPKAFYPIKDKRNKRAGEKKHGTIREYDGSTRPQSSLGKEIATFGQRHNVWRIVPVKSNRERCHPAQFPVELVCDHIISWSNEGDIVLDPFIGSGSTAVGAIRTKRHFIGYEISDEYCEIARERIEREMITLAERSAE